MLPDLHVQLQAQLLELGRVPPLDFLQHHCVLPAELLIAAPVP